MGFVPLANISDEKTVQNIQGNPCMQYLLDLQKFTENRYLSAYVNVKNETSPDEKPSVCIVA